MNNPIPAIRDRKPRTTESITISIERFLCLMSIKCAAKAVASASPHLSNESIRAHDRLTDKLKELGSIEARDFVNGVTQP